MTSLPRGEYHTLHNLLISREDGKTTQIDHVVVSPYGIFVIETKNYRGLILGKDEWKEWTQILNRHSKHRFWFGILSAYILMNCWGGLQHALALSRREKLPHQRGVCLPVVQSCAAGGTSLDLRAVPEAIRHLRDARRLSELLGAIRRDKVP